MNAKTPWPHRCRGIRTNDGPPPFFLRGSTALLHRRRSPHIPVAFSSPLFSFSTSPPIWLNPSQGGTQTFVAVGGFSPQHRRPSPPFLPHQVPPKPSIFVIEFRSSFGANHQPESNFPFLSLLLPPFFSFIFHQAKGPNCATRQRRIHSTEILMKSSLLVEPAGGRLLHSFHSIPFLHPFFCYFPSIFQRAPPSPFLSKFSPSFPPSPLGKSFPNSSPSQRAFIHSFISPTFCNFVPIIMHHPSSLRRPLFAQPQPRPLVCIAYCSTHTFSAPKIAKNAPFFFMSFFFFAGSLIGPIRVPCQCQCQVCQKAAAATTACTTFPSPLTKWAI